MFSRMDVEMTALSLQAFALGLIGFSFVKILAPAYFAREDTKTPVKIGLIALIVNFVLSVVLAYSLTRLGYVGTHAGLALAISIAAIVNAWLLYRGLRKDMTLANFSGWPRFLFRVLLSNALMTACLVLLQRPLDWWLDVGAAGRAGWLGLIIVGGAASYFAMLWLCGLRLGDFRLNEKA
jgi:putative peptidoglycan lipid II flippase